MGATCATRRRASVEVVFDPVDNARLAALCGPMDANLRQIETALDVTIARRGERFTVAGPAREGGAGGAGVAPLLRPGGARPHRRGHPAGAGGDLACAQGPGDRGAGAHDPAAHRAHRAHAAPGAVPAADAQLRHHLLRGPRGHGQDVPRRRRGGRRARARHGEAHRPHAPRGRGGREAGLPSRRPRREGRSVPAPALRRALRPHGLRQGEPRLRARRRSRSRRSPSCAGARSTIPS